jgi:hypothetical protein
VDRRSFVGIYRRSRHASIAFGLATALTLGFSASAGADDIACHGSEKPAVKAPSPEAVAAALARVRVIDAPMALCPAIDDPDGAGGLVASVDPATGALRQPTAEEMRGLRPDRSRAEKHAGTAKSSEPIALPGGGVAMEVPEELLNDVVAGIGADGMVVLHCGTRAERAGKTPVAVSRTPEVK